MRINLLNPFPGYDINLSVVVISTHLVSDIPSELSITISLFDISMLNVIKIACSFLSKKIRSFIDEIPFILTIKPVSS